MMKKFLGLPAHPLFVHVPVVLLPLVSVLAIVAALRPSVRRWLKWWLPVVAAAIFVSVQLAMMSGTRLDRALNLGTAVKHRHLAETTRIFTILLLLSTIALWWFGRQADRVGPVPRELSASVPSSATRSRPATLVAVVAALTVVFAVLSTVWVIRTGHEGARVHWSGIMKN